MISTNDNRPPSTSANHDRTLERKARIAVGLASAGFGLLIGLYAIGWPLYQAYHGAKEVRIPQRATLMAIMFVFVGISEAVGFTGVTKMIQNEKLTIADLFTLAIAVAVGLGAWWGVRMWFESLGYWFPS